VYVNSHFLQTIYLNVQNEYMYAQNSTHKKTKMIIKHYLRQINFNWILNQEILKFSM